MRMCLLFFLVFCSFGAETEFFLGKKLLQYRADLFSAVTKTAADYRLSADAAKGDYAELLNSSFQQANGIKVLDMTDFVRALAVDDNFLVVLHGSYPVAELSSLLLATGWIKSEEFFVNAERVLSLGIHDIKVAVGSERMQIIQTAELQMPGADWFRIRSKNIDTAKLPARAAILQPILSGLKDLEFYWQGSELCANLTMFGTEQASSFVLLFSQFMSFTRLFLEEMQVQGVRKAPWWSLLDFPTFADSRNYITILSGLLGSISFANRAEVFSLKILPGEFDIFLSQNMTGCLNYLLVSGPSFSGLSFKKGVGAILSSGLESENKVPDTDGCELSLKMIRQALDFYRLDSGRDVSYEEVADLLFEEGYLPDSLQCRGRKVKGADFIKTNEQGEIIIQK